jgi:hypothetical protein
VNTDFGYIGGRAPLERRFKAALEQDIARLRAFLGGDHIVSE